ncbi:hypothetical protein DTO96_102180 [Ephemeroptericola cinctiostellae]|uniref:Uncharacterized protein n=1 Tax=Ephemeroptericola cinctiostellae TaxID=2268024 RepID=A0A345DDI8_9BURK|nr:hypothetical protein [Ephemeroptericola cinctiostellae]AXF86426.1 hypothetical protein DTO96_102180 [Ephemeroptericola cinctiostellae]
MTSSSIPKTLYFKKATFFKDNGKLVLSSMLSAAAKEFKFAKDRRQNSDENGRYNKVILCFNDSEGVLCGVFASYEKGTAIAAIVENDTDTEVTINRVEVPKKGDKRQEVLEGICFFGVSKNDVIVIPSRTLKAKDLEAHLNWLITQAEQITGENKLYLAEHITKDLSDTLKKTPLTSISLGDTALSTNVVAGSTPMVQEQIKQVDQIVINEKNGWLKEFFSGLIGDNFEKLGLSEALNEEVAVALTIKFSSKRTIKQDKVISGLAVALRNVDDEVELGLKGGGRIKGDELKLKKATTIKGRDGIPEQEKAFEAIRKYFKHLIESGTIKAK